MHFDVVCIGSAGFDIFASSKEFVLSRQNKQVLLFQNGHEYDIEHAIYEVGGSGLTSAITFARQGIKTACLAKTGRDHLANQIKVVAKHEGVGQELFVSKAEHHTDMNFRIITNRAEQIVLGYYNCLKTLKPRDLRFPGLRSRACFIAQLPNDFRLCKFLLLWAKANKVFCSLHLDNANNLKEKQVLFVLGHIDRLLMPLSLCADVGLNPSDPLGCIRHLNGLGIRRCLLYDVLGTSYGYQDDTVYEAGPWRKSKPLDMTGVNEVFASSYEASLFQQKSLPEALTLASANANSVMSVMGARAGILRKPALRTIKTKTRIL